MLRSRPNHGRSSGELAAPGRRASGRSGATSTGAIPLANLSTPRNNSPSGGSRRVGKTAVKSTSVGISAGTTGSAGPNPSFPRVREETRVWPAVNPSEANALRQSVAFTIPSMTRQRAASSPSHCTCPVAATSPLLCHSSANLLLYVAKRCVSAGWSAQVILAGIRHTQKSCRAKVRSTAGATCAANTSKNTMKRCVRR